MARTLKATGPATKLIAALGVDDDGVTIRDFKGNSITVDPDVTIPGQDTFGGESMHYFRTSADGVNFNGITFNTPLPVLPYGQGTKSWTFIGLIQDFDSGSYVWSAAPPGADTNVMLLSASKPGLRVASQTIVNGATAFPTTGKFATAQIYRNGSLSGPPPSEIFFANEGASSFGAADGSAVDPMTPASNQDLRSFGGASSWGSVTANWFLALWFNDALSQTERDAILTAPLATLFEAGSGGASKVPVLMNSYRQRRR